MRRRKPQTWVQVNLRIKEELRRQLETAAKENQVSFNEEVRARLADSFEVKSRESLARTARRFEDFTHWAERFREQFGRSIVGGAGLEEEAESKTQTPEQKQKEGGNT